MWRKVFKMDYNIFKIACVFAVMVSLSGCPSIDINPSAEGLKGFSKLEVELQAYGFDMVNPITTGYRVGQIFEIRKSPKGTAFPKLLCDQTFDAKLIEENLILGDFEANAVDKFDLVLDLAKNLLKDKAEAEISLKSNSLKKVRFSLQNSIHQQLPPQIMPDGTRRSINSYCKINIKSAIDKDGRFRNPTILVIGTLISDSLVYEFHAEDADEGRLVLMVKNLFNIEPKFVSTETGNKRIIIKPDSGKRYTIGGQAIELESAEILSQVSNSFDVRLKSVKNTQINLGQFFKSYEN